MKVIKILIFVLITLNAYNQNNDESFELLLDSPYTSEWALTTELDNRSILINHSNYDYEYRFSKLILLSSNGIYIKEKTLDILITDMLNIHTDTIIVTGFKVVDNQGGYLYLITLNENLYELNRDSVYINEADFFKSEFFNNDNDTYLYGLFNINSMDSTALILCKLEPGFYFPDKVVRTVYPDWIANDCIIFNNLILFFSGNQIIYLYDMFFNYLGWYYIPELNISHNNDVFIKENGNLIIGGTSTGFNNQGDYIRNIAVVETDSMLNNVNSILIESEFLSNQAAETECLAPVEDGFFLLGTMNYTSQNEDTSFVYVSKINYDFEKVWEIDIKRPVNAIAYHITPTKNNGCIITANQVYDWFWDSDIIIYKIDSVGNQTSIHLADIGLKNTGVFPNPGSDIVHFNLPQKIKNAQLTLFNIDGKLLIKEAINNQIFNLNTISLQSGLYFYKIYNQNKVIAKGKWVKQ